MGAPTRVQKPLRVLFVGFLASLMVVVMPGTQAHAAPTVAEIEAEISKIWAQAEPLIEEYNAVHEKYKKNLAQQNKLNAKINPLARQVDLAQVRVGVIAAQVYTGGQAQELNAILASGSPTDLADQMAFLDQLAREQQRQIEGVTTMKASLDKQKAPIDKLVAELKKQDADLASKKKQIEVKLSQLQSLRIKAYGSGGSTGSYRPWPCPSAYEPTSGYKAAKFACNQAGKPYVWNADGPGSYDCSGLTLAAWRSVGVYLPHNAAAQRRSMRSVSRANIKVGDLVFYGSNTHHVAIYVGGGKVMHAPTFGDHVRMAPIDDVGGVTGIGRPG